MKDKIYKYLAGKGEKAAPKEIIKNFFHTKEHYPSHMEKIVDSMLQSDGRLVKDEQGFWRVKTQHEKTTLSELPYIILDFEYLTIYRNKLPVLFGFAEIKKGQVNSSHIFSVEPRADLSALLKSDIVKFIEQSNVELNFEQDFISKYSFFIAAKMLVSASSKNENEFNRLVYHQFSLENELPGLRLNSFLPKLFSGIKTRSIEDLGDFFALSYQTPLTIQNRLNLLYEIMSFTISELNKREIFTLDELTNFFNENEKHVDFSKYNFNQDYLNSLPDLPGVYLMKDKCDKVIYVGKSKNLKSRVQSYFYKRNAIDEKTKLIHEKVFDISYEDTGSELEALLLENKYILQFEPFINIQIEIHKTNIQLHPLKKILLILPASISEHVRLYFINGQKSAYHQIVDRENPDWNEIENQLNKLLGKSAPSESEYNYEQLEIIWRWFSINSEYVNYINIDHISDNDTCIDILANYLKDKNLFGEKSIYV